MDALQAKVPQRRAGAAMATRTSSPCKGIRNAVCLRHCAAVARNDRDFPRVLAIWVARRGAVTPEMVADFQASREYGLARIGEIAEGAALKLELPPRELERYLTENIDFSLDEENLAGLRLYYEECARAGLIPRARELEFVDGVSVAR